MGRRLSDVEKHAKAFVQTAGSATVKAALLKQLLEVELRRAELTDKKQQRRHELKLSEIRTHAPGAAELYDLVFAEAARRKDADGQ